MRYTTSNIKLSTNFLTEDTTNSYILMYQTDNLNGEDVKFKLIDASKVGGNVDLPEWMQYVDVDPIYTPDKLKNNYVLIGTNGTDSITPTTFVYNCVSIGSEHRFMGSYIPGVGLQSEDVESVINLGNNLNSYNDAINIGFNNTDAGNKSIIIGSNYNTLSPGTICIGFNDELTSQSPYSVSIGYNTYSFTQNSIALGSNARVNVIEGENQYAIQLGTGENNTNHTFQVWDKTLIGGDGKIPIDIMPSEIKISDGGISIGDDAYSSKNCVAIGYGSIADMTNAYGLKSASVAIGYNSYCADDASVAIGERALALNRYQIAIGSGSHCSSEVQNAIAIGYGSYSDAQNAIAIGGGCNNAYKNSFMFNCGDINDDSDQGNKYSIRFSIANDNKILITLFDGNTYIKNVEL